MQLSLKDLARILYQPRQTMRGILDSGQHRWTAEITALAAICAAAAGSDVRELQKELPGLEIVPTLALALLALIGDAIVWVLLLYLFSWLATLVGRKLDGQGTAADVRAALAWSLVPVIWAVILRIPLVIYQRRFVLEGGSPWTVAGNLIEQGGCTLAVMLLTVQMLVRIAVVVLASFCVGEALRFSAWKGFGTVAISAAIPIVVVIAAILAVKT